LSELRSGDLQLTIRECRDFLNDVMKLGLTHREVETLHARTEGWSAGLRLAAVALGSSVAGVRAAADFGGNHPFVFDYFADEVLSGLPEDVYSFLLHTSVAQSMCAGLCEAITGINH